jgi:hypothetical protein
MVTICHLYENTDIYLIPKNEGIFANYNLVFLKDRHWEKRLQLEHIAPD